MTREINGLSSLAYQSIISEIPRCFTENLTVEAADHLGLVYVCLNDAVILKSSDDHIILDLGGKKAFLYKEDFEEISIR